MGDFFATGREEARRGADLYAQRPWEILWHPTWGQFQSAGGTVALDQLAITVPNGRWGGVSIGPESEFGSVEIWPGGYDLRAVANGDMSRRFVVSNRRPWVDVIAGPFEVRPFNPFPGPPAGSILPVGHLQLILHDATVKPAGLPTHRADKNYAAALTALTATAETVLLRKPATGRAGGKLTLLPVNLAAAETVRVRLYGVTWNANGVYEGSTIFDQTFAAADTGIERTFHFETRHQGYKLTYLGAGTPSFNLDYDLTLRDELH